MKLSRPRHCAAADGGGVGDIEGGEGVEKKEEQPSYRGGGEEME